MDGNGSESDISEVTKSNCDFTGDLETRYNTRRCRLFVVFVSMG